MSYQVIARKWRPKAFADLVGQSHVSQTLLNALKNDRLPHALLFTGPRGTGKTSSARILAMSLRCPNAKDFAPCGKCDECAEITSGRSVDVIEVDGASNNGVDAIRELRDTVGYMPSHGKYKVYIIDEVHMLSTSAFNALLKTLEEPPAHVIFVMATTEVHKIPNTILSRCQRFDFRRISTRLIGDHLKDICKNDDISAEEEALWMVARQGDGSMRDSQSLLDQVITYSEGKITLQKVVDVLGLTDRQLLTDTVKSLVERDTEKVLAVVERIFTSGYDPAVYVQDLLEEIRHLLMIKLAPNSSDKLVDLSQAEIDRLKEISDALSTEDIHLLFDMALKGTGDVIRAQNQKVVLEVLLLRMVAAPRIVDLQKLASGALVSHSAGLQQPARPQQSTPPQHSAAPQPQKQASQPTQASGPVVSADLHDKWSEFVHKVKRVNGIVAAKLEQTYLHELKGQKIVIGVPPKLKFVYDKLVQPDLKEKITNYVSTFWGPGFEIEVVLGSGKAEPHEEPRTPQKREEHKKQKKSQELKKQIEEHPLVKSTRDVFKSEIQSIKEK